MAASHKVVDSPPADKFNLAFEQAHGSWCPANVKKIEEALREMTLECLAGNTGKYALPAYKFVFDRIHNILEFGARPEENSKLSSLLISLFQFINAVCEETSLRQTLRDDYGLMYYLSQILDPALPPEEIELLLRVVERLTRTFVVSWKPPYLELLVARIITYITANFVSSKPTHLALQFLVNICRQNPCCVMILRFDLGYRQLWQLLRANLSDRKEQKTAILISHLFFLLNPSLPVESLCSGYQIVTDWTERVLKNYEKYPEEGTIAIDNTCEGLCQTRELMKTIISKMEPIYEPLTDEIHHHTAIASTSTTKPLNSTSISLGRTYGPSSTVARSKEAFLRILTETLHKLHDFVSQLPRTDKRIADAILQYVQILLPSYLPVSLLYDSYKMALRIIDHLLKDMRNGSPEFIRCLGVCLHVVEQVVEGKERQANQSKLEIDPYLHKILSKIQLTNDVSPPGVQLNYLYIRLLSDISLCQGFFEEVLKKLDFQLVHNLVKNLTCAENLDSHEKWQRSQCAVELLSTMSKFSQNTQMLNLLLALVTTREISCHIANCIQNGDERAIRNALNVTGSTAFAENAISSITKSLTMVRQEPGAAMKFESNGYGLSANAANGAMKLNQTLKSLDDIRQQTEIKNVPLFGDMLSWYKIKQEMHEHELSSINAHVYQLNKTIAHLKSLIEKQNEFSAKRIFITEQKDWEVISLQKRLEKMAADHAGQTYHLKQHEEALQKEIKTHEERQNELQLKVKACQDQIVLLQQEAEAELTAKKDVQNKLKVALQDNRTLKKDNVKVKTDLDESKKKVALLEAALKQKEEEKEKADMLLEKEKKMLDTIRGLVGNNFANLNHGN